MMVECNTPTELTKTDINLDNSLSIPLTLPINNSGETITISPTTYYGITPLNISSDKLKGLPLLTETPNLVISSIFDSSLNCKNLSNFTPLSHSTFIIFREDDTKKKAIREVIVIGPYVIDTSLFYLIYYLFLFSTLASLYSNGGIFSIEPGE